MLHKRCAWIMNSSKHLILNKFKPIWQFILFESTHLRWTNLIIAKTVREKSQTKKNGLNSVGGALNSSRFDSSFRQKRVTGTVDDTVACTCVRVLSPSSNVTTIRANYRFQCSSQAKWGVVHILVPLLYPIQTVVVDTMDKLSPPPTRSHRVLLSSPRVPIDSVTGALSHFFSLFDLWF